MAFAGFSYRASLLYFGIRTTCSKAAKSPSFSQAINTAQTVWNENLGAWSGMTGSESVCVVGYTNSGGSGGISSTPTVIFKSPSDAQTYFSNVNHYVSNFTFLMRVNATVSMNPLLPVGGFMGLSIPGLNAPYTVQTYYESYIENPGGISS